MAVRVALNGFGRIGRNIFRVLYGRSDIEVAAICDVVEPEHLIYLLKYDSLVGPFREPVDLVAGKLCAKGRLVPFVEGRKPGDVAWRDYDVDIVIEASGRYRRRAELEGHLEAGARRVVLTVPPADAIDSVAVRHVNDAGLDRTAKIVSAGSLAINALAPIVKILDDAFGIEEGVYNLVHAYTGDQKLGDISYQSGHSVDDAPDEDLRRSRSAVENIIPASTHSPLQVGNVLPHLSDKLCGMALSAAVPDGSIIDLVTFHRHEVSVEQVNGVVKNAAAGRFNDTVEYCSEPIVSADVAGKNHSAIFDSLMTSVIVDPEACGERRSMVKTLTWYDNGWSFSKRVVDLVDELSATL